MENTDIVRIRAHHGMCIAYFEGKGYSDGFVHHMMLVKQRMQDNPRIRVICSADEVCRLCPNNRDGVCETAGLTEGYDTAVMRLCGLSDGAETEWEEFAGLVKERILEKGRRKEICGGCQWNDICEKRRRIYGGWKNLKINLKTC